MANIVLVGFMGTGKTAVGRALADRLKRRFIEIDTLIEKIEGTSIREIFEKKGEIYFRKLEKDVIKNVSSEKDVVISAGGGAVIDEENLKNLRINGVIICLEATPETIFKRVKGDNSRPLLNVQNPLERIRELLEKRRTYYEKADYFVDTDTLTVDEVVNKILSILKAI